MSIIHEALKSMDGPQTSTPDTPASQRRKRTSAESSWLAAVLAFSAVVGAGVLGWYVWQGQLQALLPFTKTAPRAGSASPAPAATLLAAAPMTPVSLQAMPAPVEAADTAPAPVASTAQTPVPGQDPLPVATVATASTAMPADGGMAPVALTGAAPAPAMARSQESSAPNRRLVSRPARQARPRPAETITAAPAPTAEDVPVELLFARFVSAMQGGQTAQAELALAALAEKLPAGSLGLLRAQAWFALQAGRDSAAADLYRTILERLPGDEGAAINLASIQSRQQQPEEARATLDAAKRLQPDSAALRAALAQFTPNARP